MAFQLMRQWRLGVLRLTVELDGTGSQILAESLAFSDGDEAIAWKDRFAPAAFGLAGRTRGTGDEHLVVPPALVEGVAAAIGANTGARSGLWLHLREPRGRLGAVPWEDALVSALDVPVLRLPNRLPVDSDTADVHRMALVVSLADPARAARELVGPLSALQESMSPGLHVDLFADRGVLDHLPSPLVGSGVDLHVHDPATAGPAADVRRARKAAVRTVVDPSSRATERLHGAALWSAWVTEGTRHTGVDTLVLVADGHLDGERGLIAVADDPTRVCDRSTLAYLQADDVRRLGEHVGAASLVVRSPVDNPAELATRLVADAVGVNRAGTTVHSSGRGDPAGRGLTDLHAWLSVGGAAAGRGLTDLHAWPSVGGFAHELPRVPGQFLYVQPELALRSGAPEGTSHLLSHEQVTASRTWNLAKATTRGSASPSWAQTAQRYVDAEARELILDEATTGRPSVTKSAYDDGRRAALSEVQAFLDRHAGGSP